MTTLIPLVRQDCGYVWAVRMLDSRRVRNGTPGVTTIETAIIVGYAVRPAFRATIAYDMGDHLADIPLAPPAAAALAEAITPTLILPGPKQGSICLLPGEQILTIYYTGREEGNPTGPFWLWKYTVPLPGLYALDRAAAARLRNVAQLLMQQGQIEPAIFEAKLADYAR